MRFWGLGEPYYQSFTVIPSGTWYRFAFVGRQVCFADDADGGEIL